MTQYICNGKKFNSMQTAMNEANRVFDKTGAIVAIEQVAADPVKTPSDLKYYVENAGHESHFFTRKTMSFFGDTMRNYGVRKTTVRTCYDESGNFTVHEGVDVEVYELYRKNPVKHGLKDSAYFDAKSFKRRFPTENK